MRDGILNYFECFSFYKTKNIFRKFDLDIFNTDQLRPY